MVNKVTHAAPAVKPARFSRLGIAHAHMSSASPSVPPPPRSRFLALRTSRAAAWCRATSSRRSSSAAQAASSPGGARTAISPPLGDELDPRVRNPVLPLLGVVDDLQKVEVGEGAGEGSTANTGICRAADPDRRSGPCWRAPGVPRGGRSPPALPCPCSTPRPGIPGAPPVSSAPARVGPRNVLSTPKSSRPASYLLDLGVDVHAGPGPVRPGRSSRRCRPRCCLGRSTAPAAGRSCPASTRTCPPRCSPSRSTNFGRGSINSAIAPPCRGRPAAQRRSRTPSASPPTVQRAPRILPSAARSETRQRPPTQACCHPPTRALRSAWRRRDLLADDG